MRKLECQLKTNGMNRRNMLKMGSMIALGSLLPSSFAFAKPDNFDVLDKAATGEVAAFQISTNPKDMPDTAFKDRDGNEMTFQDWKGKTILVNLWATWCGPCRHEMPDLDKLQAELGSDNFEVVTISLDRGDIAKPSDFFEEIGIQNLALYHDDRGKLFNEFRSLALLRGLPFTVLIGPDGKDMGFMNGPAAWASQDAQNLIMTTLDAG